MAAFGTSVNPFPASPFQRSNDVFRCAGTALCPSVDMCGRSAWRTIDEGADVTFGSWPSNKRINLTVRPVTRLAGAPALITSKGGGQGARPSRPAGYPQRWQARDERAGGHGEHCGSEADDRIVFMRP